MIKNLPVNAGDRGSIPGLGRSPLERNGNPFLAWKTPWTKEIGGLRSMGLHDMESDMTENTRVHTFIPIKRFFSFASLSAIRVISYAYLR